MSIRRFFPANLVSVSAVILTLVGLYLTSLYSYLLFHALVELITMIIAGGIFVLVWNTRQFNDNDYLLFVGVSYFFIVIIDLVHTLAYKDMGVFQGYNANLPTQLWIAARYLQCVSLLVAPFFTRRKLNIAYVTLAYALITTLLLMSIFVWQVFPVCYVEGTGLTSFKIISEYVISAILLAAIAVLFRKRAEFDEQVFALLISSFILTIGAELIFTSYVSVYGFLNLTGHIFKLGAFYLIYKAIIETGLRKPYTLLFRDLAENRASLQHARDELELRVQKRTADLVQSNASLQKEIAERKQAEEKLQLTQFTVDHVADSIFWIDADARFVYVNEAVCRQLGYSQAELLTMYVYDIDPNFTPQIWPAHWRDIEQRGALKVETLHRAKDGREIAVEVIANFMKMGNQPFNCAFVRDITERKLAEEEIRQLNTSLELRVEERTRELRDAQEQLIRHEKLAVLGQVAGSMGHELRNPLGVISNAVYFLKMVQADASDKIKEYLDTIERETRISEKIVTDLLDFTRVESAQRAPVSVSQLVHIALERFPAPESVQVVLDLPANLPNAYADSQHVVQVLGNLVLNAYQAMNDGGKLTVIGHQSSGTTPLITDTSTALSTGNWILITVRDTGSGISPENIKKLFEPLFTTRTQGIGLGLAVSKKLIEANGGRIEVESEVGVGSTFTLYLPVYKNES
jgi:PAS domain S-box-containing protein